MGQEPPRLLRVLVVEDYEDARESLSLLLRLWGYACKSASDGCSAVHAARVLLPDVVLLDIGLPDMNGYEAARAIRVLPGMEGTVFAAVSGYAADWKAERSLLEGFAAHFTKPCDPDELSDWLATIEAERRQKSHPPLERRR